MNSSINYDILKALSEKEISIEDAAVKLGISATPPTDHYYPGTVLAGDDGALIYIFIKHYAGPFADKWVAHNWYYGVIEKGLVYDSYEQLQQAFPGCGFKVIHHGWLSSLLAP